MMHRYLGLDTHKAFVVAAAVDEQQQVLMEPQRVKMSDLAEWAARTLTPQDQVVIEVTSNTWSIYEVLATYAGHVVVANPYKTRLIAEARIKSDKVDALVLARPLAAHFICEVWVPTADGQQHRALVAHRVHLSQQASRVKNRIHALLSRHNWHCPVNSVFSTAGQAWLEALPFSPLEKLEVQHLRQQLTLLQTQLKETERQIAQLAAQDERIPRLMQLPGVGCFIAFALLAAIGDIHRFASPKQLASYAGLVPSLHQSGQRAKTGPITKAGNPQLRWLMTEAAQIAVRFDPHWQQVCQRIQQKHGKGVALVAVARKLLVVVWHLLHDQTLYYHLQPQMFVRKLQEWAWLIGPQQVTEGSAASFARQQLKTMGLHDLAIQLTTNRKGKLKVADAGNRPPMMETNLSSPNQLVPLPA